MTATIPSALRRTSGYIGGTWVKAQSRKTFEVTNPATFEVLAEVTRMGATETHEAVAAASAALAEWSTMTPYERAVPLRRWAELIRCNREHLGRLIVLEQGKPRTEAESEVTYAASFLDWYAEEAKRPHGELIPSDNRDKRLVVLRKPIGVGAAITPWNFPAAMITRKAAPALAAGCTLILKPAEQTPLTGCALVALAEEAGLPGGVLNLVVGSAADAPAIGTVLTEQREVHKLSFTGSTAVGSQLMGQAAPTVTSVSLELGGNAPFLVLDDADLDAAVDGLVMGKFRNAGQTCISANRILVAAGVYDALVERLLDRVAALRTGNGLDPGTDVGPLIDTQAVAKVEQHVADAIARGAVVRCGGARHELGRNFFQPTVLTGGTSDMVACNEETFGPVAVLVPFETEQEAIELANDTPYGLAAYLYTRDTNRTWRMAESLDCGIVGVNTSVVSTAAAPFGGVKMSGIGREGSTVGLDDWFETKLVCQSLL